MNAREFRDLLTAYLTEPEYAKVIPINDDDKVCMGVTLDDGSRLFVTIEKMADGPFPGTEGGADG